MNGEPVSEKGDRREGEGGRTVISPPPIDMDHLSGQTLGDESIAREVLDLFLIELGTARATIVSHVEEERREVAHRLKGSARSMGAFALADSAADVEDAPSDTRLVGEFLDRLADLEEYIGSLRDRAG